MRHPRVALLSGLLLPLLAILLFRTAVANAAPAQSCAWNAVSAPNPSGNDQVNAVAATSATDAWIVGYYYTSSNDVQTLIEHWNGTRWSIVPSPNVTTYDELNAVTALSATNAWAVGVAYSSTNATTLIEHWDGSSWSIVKSPNLGLESVLKAVTPRSASDIWTGGYNLNNNNGPQQTLIEHWNGSSWSIVKSPSP